MEKSGIENVLEITKKQHKEEILILEKTTK